MNQIKKIIEMKEIYKIFQLGNHQVKAVNGVSLDIYEGEICCFLGTSGSGKSTLLNLMAGFEKPSKGSIKICNSNLEKLDEQKLTEYRQQHVGFIFQAYNLLESLTALDNVSLPLTFRGVHRKDRIDKAKDILKAVGLEGYDNHKPSQMSGGQQQRVGIARALICKPRILFADEPTGNLDTKTTDDVIKIMVDIAKANNQTMIMVTHEPELSKYADRTFHMKDGIIEKIENHNEVQKWKKL